ncbi:ATP-dependent DNA ligase [Treponema primitia]|uniref:ATP-dependent DNA ligase n=1 Tax=Treponema primitia TaxID=88058 RepID=UPI000255580C|nr:ATP-dependent DNA ligase [Treponema primitia]
MSLLNLTEALPRKSTVIFLIIDTCMPDLKRNILEAAITQLQSGLHDLSGNSSETCIETDLLYYEGEQEFSAMCDTLRGKLSTKTFLKNPQGYYPPVIVLFSAGSSNSGNFVKTESALVKLHANNWWKAADVSAVAIGKASDRGLLVHWTGNTELVLDANTPSSLERIVGSINAPRFSRVFAAVDSCEEETQPQNNDVLSPKTEEDKHLDYRCDQTVPAEYSQQAVNYKKNISKNFVPLNPSQIGDRLYGSEFFVTRKYDGLLTLLFWENGGETGGGKLTLVNSSGKTLDSSLPCAAAAVSCFRRSKIQSAIIAAELYTDESDGRTRVTDTLSALAKKGDHSRLRLAPFDIVSIDGVQWQGENYGKTHAQLGYIFTDTQFAGPVRCTVCHNKFEVQSIFAEWVEGEGSEGLVVRTGKNGLYKIKPRQTIDAAVVGFSEVDGGGAVRSLLYALMKTENGEAGQYQIIGRTGNGLTTEQKKSLYSCLMAQKIPSNYVEVDSNHAAFHLVKPELVVELSVNDVLTENAAGLIRNPLLALQGSGLNKIGAAPGYSFVSAVIERFRDDKTVNPVDVRLSQFSVQAELSSAAMPVVPAKIAPSKVLFRRVYKKEASPMMVQKYVVWCTNKGETPRNINSVGNKDYPSFVFSYTNFSAGRAEPLAIEVRVSESKEQIMDLCRRCIEKEVKTGWVQIV